VVNAARKRLARWGAGRLALALAPARVVCLAVSDVPGDDPTTIGSGPCVPDPWTRPALLDALAPYALPEPVRAALAAAPETPKPGDAAFARATVQVLLGNADARRAAAAAARGAGCP
jgi:hydroxypyruvate reductase